MKRPLYCQKCHVEIFYDLNMVMIKDELWLTHFKKEDAFCDLCIEEKIGRKIIHDDLKLRGSDGDMIPCNLFWEEEQLNKKQI